MIRGLLEVLKNTNVPNDTNINAAGLLESFKEHELSEWHEFLFYSVDSSDSCSFSQNWICVLLEVLKNTNYPNDTNLYLFG